MHVLNAAISERPPMRYRLSRWLSLLLAKSLKVPRVPAIRIGRAVNIACTPLSYLRRRRLARYLARPAGSIVTIDKNEGYSFTSPQALPEIAAAVRQASEIYAHAAGDDGLARFNRGKSRKEYLARAADGAQMSRYLDIMRLALARPVLDAVADYLGTIPIINNISVMVSLPNESELGSQLYHLDFADERQVKLFVFVDTVTADSGPLTFVPAPGTNRVIATLKYDRGRLRIDEVEAVVGKEGQIAVTGPAGTAVLVDTCRCLHYGSNRNKSTRVAILIQYADCCVPEQRPTTWPVQTLTDQMGLDEIQRLALTV